MTREMILSGLETYRANVERIANLEKDIEKWKSVAMSLGDSIGSGMPGSHNSGNARYTKAIESLADIESIFMDEIATLKDSLKTTISYINLENNPRRQMILQMRYVDGLPMSRIAIQIDRNVNTVYKIHNTAINDIVKATKRARD